MNSFVRIRNYERVGVAAAADVHEAGVGVGDRVGDVDDEVVPPDGTIEQWIYEENVWSWNDTSDLPLCLSNTTSNLESLQLAGLMLLLHKLCPLK